MHAKIDDSPAGLALLLKGGKSSDAPEDGGGDGDLPDGMHDAADDLISAVHSKDTEGVAHALHNAHSLSAEHMASKKG